ncbi:uncharacterized protein LOC142964071 isoform X2 [Anarhichas minor]|uniref:uncharacterized protein LOC142964071 isoform X2 n=1 Tax=Anarhichas minor TaxID=65739 RepID=UPI003F7396FA
MSYFYLAFYFVNAPCGSGVSPLLYLQSPRNPDLPSQWCFVLLRRINAGKLPSESSPSMPFQVRYTEARAAADRTMLQHVVLYLALSSFVSLKLCGAADIPCTVSRDGQRTVYSVPKFNETDCIIQWVNETNYVIANDGEPTVGRTVVLNTNRTLITNECSKIIYRRTCFPEGVQQMATCTPNCSRTSAVPNGREFAYLILPVAISVVLLVLGLLYKFRDRIPRCRILCCRYDPVKTQDTVIV